MIRRVVSLEWHKWRARRESWWSVGFLLVGAAAYGALTLALQESALTPAIPGINTGDGGGFLLAVRTASSLYRVLGVFLLLWSATSLAGEVESGTLRMPLLRLPRRSFPLGKAVFLMAVGSTMGLAILLIALIVGALGYGLGGIHAGRVLLYSGAGLFGTTVAAGLLTLLPLAATVALGIWASSMVKSAQAAVSLAVVLGTILLAGGLAPQVGPFLFPATTGWPFAVAGSQAEGLKTEILRDGVMQHVLVNLAWIAVLLAGASWRFQRRDLTA